MLQCDGSGNQHTVSTLGSVNIYRVSKKNTAVAFKQISHLNLHTQRSPRKVLKSIRPPTSLATQITSYCDTGLRMPYSSIYQE